MSLPWVDVAIERMYTVEENALCASWSRRMERAA